MFPHLGLGPNLYPLKIMTENRAEILLGEKEDTRADLLRELRRLVATEANLTVPQVIQKPGYIWALGKASIKIDNKIQN